MIAVSVTGDAVWYGHDHTRAGDFPNMGWNIAAIGNIERAAFRAADRREDLRHRP